VNTWLAGINANGTKLNQDVQGGDPAQVATCS
jgi:hypothetical protein